MEKLIPKVSIGDIAKVCHEVNRAYCDTVGDPSQKAWEKADDWQRTSAIEGVDFFVRTRATAEELHENWCRDKIEAGWSYGPVKDAEKKEHPCLVPYNKLPMEQRVKDYLFRAVVKALCH